MEGVFIFKCLFFGRWLVLFHVQLSLVWCAFGMVWPHVGFSISISSSISSKNNKPV
jgi:hypothetical protein